MDVYVSEVSAYAGSYLYYVFVDGEKYDEFSSTRWITHAQMIDVARGYEEGLTDPTDL